MATNSDIFKKFITGEAIGADTDGGQLPVLFEGMPTGHLNAPYSSCSITASAAVTYNGTVYAAGDVLFYSDGYTIFNSTGNQMSGNDATVNGLTGGVRSAPQAVSFMKVSDALSGTVTGGTLPGSTGAIFWCFFNGMENGIRVGIIDMNGDSGKGIFINYLNIGQSGGGLVGVLNNTDGGVCGRMVTQCYNHHTLIVDIEGVAIITMEGQYISVTRYKVLLEYLHQKLIMGGWERLVLLKFLLILLELLVLIYLRLLLSCKSRVYQQQ